MTTNYNNDSENALNINDIHDLLEKACFALESGGVAVRKEIMKKTPSAHFCKRYNILLRQAKQLLPEVNAVLWPPELPAVDDLKDEQLVPHTNYKEIEIYCKQALQAIQNVVPSFSEWLAKQGIDQERFLVKYPQYADLLDRPVVNLANVVRTTAMAYQRV